MTALSPTVRSQELDKSYFEGHRYAEEKSGGWGWIKKPGEDWNRAKWVTMKENPPAKLAPFRKLGGKSADHNHEYKLWGTMADYKAYDPHKDEWSEVFIIDRYESLGEAAPLKRKPGPPDRFSKSKKSGASSRGDRPILGQDEDGF